MDGTIKRIVLEKGFGFIKGKDGQEYFFHRSMVSGLRFEQLGEGVAVTFEPGPPSDKGKRAASVQA